MTRPDSRWRTDQPQRQNRIGASHEGSTGEQRRSRTETDRSRSPHRPSPYRQGPQRQPQQVPSCSRRITRFPDGDHLASYAGTAPIEATSGDVIRHRLLGEATGNSTTRSISLPTFKQSSTDRAATTTRDGPTLETAAPKLAASSNVRSPKPYSGPSAATRDDFRPTSLRDDTAPAQGQPLT